MKSLSLEEFNDKMKALLLTDELASFVAQDSLSNGLQSRGKDEIQTIGFGVSANMKLFEMAKKAGCDAIVVHHGINMQAPNLDRLSYERLAYLIKNDITLWSSHFLLDAHPELGHPAQIIKLLDGRRTEAYLSDGAPWGSVGELQNGSTLESVVATLKPHFSERTVVYDDGPDEVKRIVVATGAGAPYSSGMDELMDKGIDLFITGEAREWNRDLFREAGIHFIAGGHYHSEAFGVRAVQKEAEKWGLNTLWLDAENPL
ncbi:MAG: Nif3-like dinuclear metal center hexameric protein [Candidatus Kerfeldbacteria bacterium]